MQSVSLTVLTSPGCTHCHHFLEFWKKEAVNWPSVAMTEISTLTEEGQQLALAHNVFASPGIIVGGELFSSGGYNEKEFLARLEEASKGA